MEPVIIIMAVVALILLAFAIAGYSFKAGITEGRSQLKAEQEREKRAQEQARQVYP